MNVLVVDTSSWISYFKGIANQDIDLGLREGRVYLSPITISELLSGKLKDSDKKKLREFLFELPLCLCNFEHWVRVGELRAKLLTKGMTISTPDAHIAQCTLDLDGYLISEDAIFRKFPKDVALKIL